ncbi:MAG: HAD-IIIA family hydrolase [Gemmatimonadales bacterium]|nr:HAD-IIIA family hydrolase [Gemmatimonadales bacterium]
MLTDVDGVLTDAGVYVGPEGEVMKRFTVRDGMGVERLRTLAGLETGIITRERSPIVERRAEKLRITELHLGVLDKLPCARSIAERRGIPLSAVAYIGDDVNDLELLGAVGLSACPADAEPPVRGVVHHVCAARGGHGAFRELAELILAARAGAAADPPGGTA